MEGRTPYCETGLPTCLWISKKSALSRLSFLISKLGVIMFMKQGNVYHIVAGT